MSLDSRSHAAKGEELRIAGDLISHGDRRHRNPLQQYMDFLRSSHFTAVIDSGPDSRFRPKYLGSTDIGPVTRAGDMAPDPDGRGLYVTEYFKETIWFADFQSNEVQRLPLDLGRTPCLGVDASGRPFVYDQTHKRLVLLTPEGGSDGPDLSSLLNEEANALIPDTMCVSAGVSGEHLWFIGVSPKATATVLSIPLSETPGSKVTVNDVAGLRYPTRIASLAGDVYVSGVNGRVLARRVHENEFSPYCSRHALGWITGLAPCPSGLFVTSHGRLYHLDSQGRVLFAAPLAQLVGARAAFPARLYLHRHDPTCLSCLDLSNRQIHHFRIHPHTGDQS